MHQPSRPQTAPPEDARVAAPRGGLGDLDLDSTFSGGAYFRFLSDTMDKGATHSPQNAVPPRPSTATGWSSAHAIGSDQVGLHHLPAHTPTERGLQVKLSSTKPSLHMEVQPQQKILQMSQQPMQRLQSAVQPLAPSVSSVPARRGPSPKS